MASRIVDGSEWQGLSAEQAFRISRAGYSMWVDAYVHLNSVKSQAWQTNDDATFEEIDNLLIELYLIMKRKGLLDV